MKKIKRIFLCALLLFVWILPLAAYAHPARSVEVKADASGNVTVTAPHKVDDPAKHYINKVVIFINGKAAVQKEYKSQASAEAFSDTFNIAAPAGSTVKAEVVCVIMGVATGETVVK